MTEAHWHWWLCLSVLACAVLVFVALFFISAPYGRHARTGWGPSVSSRIGWVLMESPSAIGFAAIFSLGAHALEAAPLALATLWLTHYVNRTFVYPMRLKSTAKPMPLSVVAMGFSFNCINAYLNARWLSELGTYSAQWLFDPRFIAGVTLFVGGMALNVKSDAILFALRRPGTQGYQIPHGGAYRWVSSPNYFGELIEWGGFALAAWSLPAVAFFIFTAANLVPRAISHHRWYREQFADYPPGRKAIIPFVW